MTEPNIEFLDESTIKDRVAKFILDGKHWLLLPGFSGANALIDLENTFYSGEKNNDFEMMIIPVTGRFMPVLTIAFADKQHMSAADFAKHIHKRQGDSHVTEATLREKDVIFLARFAEARLLAEDFYDWIKPAVENLERGTKNG